ncbi:PAX-interacting protein 1 [Senna tora]|uniref:PAX-interacting protein 1 n=1 Tax=Senna tora TaxID=362788 RepID=A0A835CD14_9FABA|nr:PAX-interacting protein 1 [Senna tora]
MAYHGNHDATTTSTDKNQVANVDCFETEPFESQLSPSSSPWGKYDDGGDNKWQFSENTLLLNDNTVVEDALETQLVILAGETQPMDDIDDAEDMNTQLLDDSGGEGTNRTQVLEDVDELFADDAHYGGSGQSANSNDIPREPSCGHGEKRLLVQNDGIIDDRTSSGPIPPRFTFLRAESLREAALAARNMAPKQTKGETNSVMDKSLSQEPLAVKDGEPGGSGKRSGVIEGFMDKTKAKVVSTAMRKLFDDELRAEKKGSSPRSSDVNEGEDLAKLPIYDGELSGLSYVDSQEPGELSQAKALEFIDKFIEENIMEFDQEVSHVKNVQEKSKPYTKGKQSLAKRTNDRGKASKAVIYDWDNTREDEGGGDIFVRKRDKFFDGQSHRQKSYPGVSIIKVSEPNAYEDGEEQLSISNKRMSSAYSDSGKLLQNPKARDVQETATNSRRNLNNGFDKQFNINFSIGELEPNAMAADAQEMLDVGLDTQMAAEAMEALCNGEGIVNHDARGATHATENSPKDPPHCFSAGKTSAIASKECSTQYGRKRKLNVTSDLQTSGSSERYTKEAKLLCKKDNLMKRSKRSKLNAEDNITSIVVSENGSNLPSQNNGQRKSTRGSKTHLVDRLNNCTGTVKGSGLRSVKQRHLQEQDGLGYFTPIACRTRQSLVINQLVKPDRPSRNFGEEDRGDGSLRKRNRHTGIQASKALDPKSTIEGSDHFGLEINTIFSQIEKLASKFSTVGNGIIVDALKVPKRKRSVRKLSCHNKGSEKLGGSSKQSTQCEDIGKSNAKTIKRMTEASSVPKSNMNGQIQSLSYSVSIISSIDPEQGKMLEPILETANAGNTSLCHNVDDKDANLNSETTIPSQDSRKRRDMADVRVLFSHHLDKDIIKHQKKILVGLGASVATSISYATHFIADEFVRTRNMLEAIASGKPVVTHLWIESCGQACCFIDEKNYILRDAKKEKEFSFSMPVSLARASQFPLLEGHKVLITPNVKPSKEIISSLVKVVQGQAVERIGRSALKNGKIPDDLLVLSCEEDYTYCVPFLEKGAAIYSSELLLIGIITQKLECERHRLFADHVKKRKPLQAYGSTNKCLLHSGGGHPYYTKKRMVQKRWQNLPACD